MKKDYRLPSLNDARKRNKEVSEKLDFFLDPAYIGLGDGKKFYIITHGCQANQRDSETMAGLLNAMGYRTKLSPRGGDSGIDITAYKDELPPRIVVQVKSQDSDIKETTLQSLRGAMSEGDYGVFVALTNYTKNAQRFLDKTPIIRGIDGSELVDLILKYYDKLSEKYRKMIPLKMVYIPVTDDQGE